MRISDNEVKRILGKSAIVQEIVGIGQDAAQRETDRPLIEQVTKDVIEMPDREELIQEIKAKLEAGEYNPSGDEIADAMIRRNIADRVQ